MCRLFGFRSAASERVHDALVLERNSLRRQSLEHPDGWGIASWQDAGLPLVARGLGAAHLDPEFERVSSARPGTHGARAPPAGLGGLGEAGQRAPLHPRPVGLRSQRHAARLRPASRGDRGAHRARATATSAATPTPSAASRSSSPASPRGPIRLGTPTLRDVQWALATVIDEVARITDVDVGNGKRSAMNFLVTDGDLLAATRRDRTLFFAAESDEGVPLRERPASGTRVYALEVASEELQGPDVWHEVPAGRRDRHRPRPDVRGNFARDAASAHRGHARPHGVSHADQRCSRSGPPSSRPRRTRWPSRPSRDSRASGSSPVPSVEHVSLGRGLRVVILLVLWAGGSVLSLLLGLGAGGLPGGRHHAAPRGHRLLLPRALPEPHRAGGGAVGAGGRAPARESSRAQGPRASSWSSR